jgi:phospholipid/cholesterol/gamma-HCH transport system substrate-binding protein
MRKKRKGMSTFTWGLITIALAAIVTYFGFTKAIPFQHHFTIKAAFKSAVNIRPNSPVRIAGVNVGKVTDVEPEGKGPNQGALVSMEVSDNGLPIHTDARAAIRPRIFLEGNFFVDIQPGTPNTPKLGDGDTIPIQQTHTPVQLDQILGALQADTRSNLSILLQEYAHALQPPGATGFNASIPYWEPAYKNTAIVNQAFLGEKPGDLEGFMRNSGTVAQALDANPAQLQSLITDFNRTAAAFSANQSALEQTVAELPRTLRAAVPALHALNASFPAVRALVAKLRPAVRSTGPMIDATMPFIKQARGLVSEPELRGLTADLVPTVPALGTLNYFTVPLLQQVREASSCQNQVILPWTKLTVPDQQFPAKHDVAEEAPQPLVGLSGEGRSMSPNGFWFRVMPVTGEFAYDMGKGSFGMTGLPLLGSNPPKAQQRPPLRPDVPCETQPVPNLKSNPGPAPKQVPTALSLNPDAYKALISQLEQQAVGELQNALTRTGLDKQLQVSDQPATPGDLSQLASSQGNGSQLSQVQQQVQQVPLVGGGTVPDRALGTPNPKAGAKAPKIKGGGWLPGGKYPRTPPKRTRRKATGTYRTPSRRTSSKAGHR